jgi:transcriptional adapter 2-alpha
MVTEPSRKRKRTQSPSASSNDSLATTGGRSSPSSPTSPTSTDLQNTPYHVKAIVSTTTSTTVDPNATKSSSGAKYHCNYCKKDISNKVRIKCAHCQDFDLCVDCFFVGVETALHKNNHAYRVMDDLSAPLYTAKWSADEELLLLEGIEQFGLGNWVDIAEHVGTKNRFECEFHYWTTYIDVPTFPVPPPRTQVSDEPVITSNEVRKNDEGMLLWLDRLNPKKQEKKRKVISSKLANLGTELGFMPLRNDFVEKEFENEAEEMLAEMEITENDSEEERQRKLRLLQVYDYILDEREKRKKFALDRGIIADWKKISSEDKKRPRSELELCEKYRKFARFLTPDKFSSLMESVLEERRITRRIEQLQNYRKAGIMALEQGEQGSSSGSKKTTTSITSVNMLSSNLGKSAYCYSSKPKNQSSRYRADYEGAFDIRFYPGAELLSQRERDLCTDIKLAPRSYMVIKDTISREGFRLNHMGLILTKKMACDFFCSQTAEEANEGTTVSGLDRAQVGLVYDFMVVSHLLTI